MVNFAWIVNKLVQNNLSVPSSSAPAMTMTMTIFYSTIDMQIEIIMYNSLENQIINWSGDYY